MNIVLTGASTGIGYQLSKLFAKGPQDRVFALARSEENLRILAATSPEGRIIPVVLDISSFDFKPLLGSLEEKGVEHIDILIHNAGVLVNKPFEELDKSDWEAIYNTNVIGAALLTRALLPFMGGDRHTHIVSIGSIGGVTGTSKFAGLSAYSSSKGALTILSECLAEEFKGRNMTSNCLALGAVQTKMLEKAFPGYVAKLTAEGISDYIYDFSMTGWRHFSGKTIQVSVTNP